MLTEELDEPERLVKLSRIDPVCVFHVTSPVLRNPQEALFDPLQRAALDEVAGAAAGASVSDQLLVPEPATSIVFD